MPAAAAAAEAERWRAGPPHWHRQVRWRASSSSRLASATRSELAFASRQRVQQVPAPQLWQPSNWRQAPSKPGRKRSLSALSASQPLLWDNMILRALSDNIDQIWPRIKHNPSSMKINPLWRFSSDASPTG